MRVSSSPHARGLWAFAALSALACGSSDTDATTNGTDATTNGTGTGAAASTATTAGVTGSTNTQASAGPSSGSGGNIPTPDTFWDASDIPTAQNVMTFVFLNRTNGRFGDDELYWRFSHDQIEELHSFAEAPTYDMPANASGRMYFYVCAKEDPTCAGDPTESKYYDFIEHTIGPDRYNGNTTRVDAFGLKLAMRLHCADGFEATVGETYETFVESREATFQAFIDRVSDPFKPLAQPPHAPYRIVEPGAAGFGAGGPHEHYFDPFVDALWAANGITVPKPGPNGSGLAAHPNLSAAIFRHVGDVAGTFAPDGTLLDDTLWDDPSTFYQSAPSNDYARFWHERGIDGKAYGFPYDDVGSYSTYVSHDDPEYLLVAVGW